MKATREVDTVIVEMDISTAEKLVCVLGQLSAGTRQCTDDLWELRDLLVSQAEVRSPSPLWLAHAENNRVYIDRRED